MKTRIFFDSQKRMFFPQYRRFGFWRCWMENLFGNDMIDVYMVPVWFPSCEQARQFITDRGNERALEKAKNTNPNKIIPCEDI